MNVVIIDDEKDAIILLETILKENFPKISNIYTASNLDSGVQIIKKNKPEIVFLDIEMPKYSGLEIVDFFSEKEITFDIIFVTAYNKYAIDAFKISAIDYILKPINIDHLKEAVKRSIDNRHEKALAQKLEVLKKLNYNSIPIEVPKGIIFLSYDEIQYMEADGSYTKIYTSDEELRVVSKPLKFFHEQLIENKLFFRSHRSYLINIKFIKEYNRIDGGYLLMKNKVRLPISKIYQDQFLHLVKKML